MILYRCMSEAELQDVLSTGVFRAVPGSLEGKWLATSIIDAAAWGGRFTQASGVPHDRIVEADLPDGAASRAYFVRRLDGIGPAYFVDESQLPSLVFRRVVT